jgi:hypothetical protein
MTRTHSDPYRLSTAVGAPRGASSTVSRGDVVRALLWTVLVLSVVGNSMASFGAAGIGVHLACGIVTAFCAAILVVRKLRAAR